MKHIIIIILLAFSVNGNAQLKAPTQVKFTNNKEFVDTCKGKDLQYLVKYYQQYKQVQNISLLNSKVLHIQLEKFFIIATVRSNYIQLSYYPNDELCAL